MHEARSAETSKSAAHRVKLYPVYQVKVTLLDTDPPVWRRLQVPGTIRLSTLHRYIQAAMGWQDYHLHEFRIGERFYGIHDEEYLDPKHVTLRDSWIPLTKVAPIAPAAFIYEYDFGDAWQHLILVEELQYSQEPMRQAVCLDGARACPPEDCGGTHGYRNFLEAIGDPDHEDHDMFLTWAGGSFDPDFFDLGAANRRLEQIKRARTANS